MHAELASSGKLAGLINPRPREALRLLRVHLLHAPVKDKPASDTTKRDLVLIIDKTLPRDITVMAN